MATEVHTIGVLGGGQMGTGITQIAAQCGIAVRLADASPELAEKSKARLAATLQRLVDKGKIVAADAKSAIDRVQPVGGMDGFADCDLVVEAVSENLELKSKLVRQLDEAVRADAILATNTSSISITRVAGATRRPERVIGMHFMNPVPLMQLVEVIRALQTSDAVYAATLGLAARLNKTVVTSKDSPGFIVNRVLIPMLNEACFALQEGVGTADDIDAGVTLGLNHPMGPLQLADYIGLDTVVAIAEVMQREFGDDKYRPANILRLHVAAGWLGVKSGRGFYRYENGKIQR